MLTRAIRHVNAFTAVPLEGNPAAVVDGDDIPSDVMQRIALNQKLSETVFLLPPGSSENHARLRIFTPAAEIPFAGHPTLAAAHTLMTSGRAALKPGEALRLETGAGIVPVEVTIGNKPVAAAGEPPFYSMTQQPPTFAPSPYPLDEIASWLGLQRGDVVRAAEVSTGFGWLVAQVASFDTMLRVEPQHAIMRAPISIFCVGTQTPGVQVRVRTFAYAFGIPEDPVTGSSNGCIAALIARDGLLAQQGAAISYVAEQGIEMGQPGRVFLRVTGMPDRMRVQVGGHAVTVLRGELTFPV